MRLHKNLSASILIPQNPLATEQFAAEELAAYLKKSIGLTATITTAPEADKYAFIIGCPSRNASASAVINGEDFAKTVPGPEGIYINIGDDATLIAGSEDKDGRNRGTLYAVYEYLERYLGCCFGAFANPEVPGGEIVPVYDELVLENGTYSKAKADLPTRGAHIQYNNWAYDAEHGLNISFFDYLLKNRYNLLSTWTGVYDHWVDLGLIPELVKRGFSLCVGGHHAIETWLPPFGNKHNPIRYVEEHPTYFRLQEDGTRWCPTETNRFGGQMVWCCSNMEMIEEAARNIVKWVDDNPLVDHIHFAPNDFKAPQCCCDECSKHLNTENYVSFANKLISLVHKERPNVNITICSYSTLWHCPENMTMEDGLQLLQTVWAPLALGSIRCCGNPDGSGMIGTNISDNMLKWRKLTKDVIVYEYYMGNYGNRHRILPAADEMQAIYKFYVENGIGGGMTQIECFNIWNNPLNFYSFGRVAYDTDLSFEDQVQSFCKMFGNGADYVGEIIRIYENNNNGQVPLREASQLFIDTIDKEKVYALFDQALEAAGNDICAANNVRLMRMAFRYTMLDREEVNIGDPECDELIYMCRNFNSYLTKGGYGIALPVNYYLTEAKLFNFRDPEGSVADLSKTDKWYMFK